MVSKRKAWFFRFAEVDAAWFRLRPQGEDEDLVPRRRLQLECDGKFAHLARALTG
jgi:hypothetical protein